MKYKIKNFINENWLYFIIITQPILDIIAYFTFNEHITPISFIARSIYLLFILLFTFIKTKDKKKFLICESPFILFSIIHILNSIRTSGFDIFDDLRYLILVMQFPIITISLCLYVKENRKQKNKIEKGFITSLIIIFISVVLSIITKNYNDTYENYGITGWFTSANTQSMILVCLVPYSLYWFSKRNKYIYTFGIIISYFLLIINATRACYYTLIAGLFVIFYVLITHYKIKLNMSKVWITLGAFLLTFALFRFSYTYERKLDVSNTNSQNQEMIDKVEKLDKNTVIELLKNNELYGQMINDFGEERVYKEMKDKISASSLSDNRLAKRMYSKIVFDDSDIFTKLVGFNHNKVGISHMDLENDLTAIFYYYGYLGFALYILFILYFAYLALKLLLKNPLMLFSGKFIMLNFSILLAIFGSEFSGALLRKSNANIYLALLLVLQYTYVIKKLQPSKLENNKITFLLLHLGYGGIETATINTANSLCEKYNIDLISFYKLQENQAEKLNKSVKIRYLYDSGPNKEEIIKSYRGHNYIKLIKEGIKAVDILIKKKILIIDSIIENNSKYIISTRWEFSILLSKFGRKDAIKIAQEHHYHNNDKKYINVLTKKYTKIDYLFALTKTLEIDYKKFLKNNHHTKVVLMPNMLYSMPNKISNLKSKNIVTVSRLDVNKKNDEIIKAFSKLKNKDWKLYIIGDGQEYLNLEKLIRDLNLEHRVFLTGYKNKTEIEKYMLNSSIFLMASVTEGLPMVLLEAMSYGIPTIAYETASGVNDIIINTENGFVVKNRNEKEYIEKITTLIEDEPLRKEMGKNALKSVSRFSKDVITKKWCKIIK